MATFPRRVVDVGVPLALGALELFHPAWPNGSVSQAVAAAGGLWIPLHVALIVGYGLLVASLWPPHAGHASVARAALGVFFASNLFFLAIDGVAVGQAAQSGPASADTLWSSPLVDALANISGATWSLALLAVAAAHLPVPRARSLRAGIGLTWLTFVASSYVPSAALVSRAAAVATGAWAVYTAGAYALPFGLLVFAAILRQHVGPEAALGMGCIALARATLGHRPAAV